MEDTKMARTIVIAYVLIAAILAAIFTACSVTSPQISEQDAIIIAKGVIGAQTKFYAKIGNESVAISSINVTSQSAFFDGKNWNVAFHIAGIDEGGMPRQNDVVVVMNSQGEVIGLGSGKVKK
jgi:hypothetical protein